MSGSDSDQVLDSLIEDAELVARAASRMAKTPPDDFYPSLAAAKRVQADPTADRTAATAALQRTFGGALAALAPVTFANLKAGWDPFTPAGGAKSWAGIVFGGVCVLLIAAVCWGTLIYNRSASVHATLVEIQSAKTYEQLIQLISQIKVNKEKLKAAIDSGQPEPALEALFQTLREIRRVDERQALFWWMSGQLVADKSVLGAVLATMGLLPFAPAEPLSASEISKAVPTPNQLKTAYDEYKKRLGSSYFQSIDLLFDEVELFKRVAEIQAIQTRGRQGLDTAIVAVRELMNLLGGWVLPFVYGMLGAGVYHMRRYLDPLVPDPHWLRSAYRMLLGGFAGIIIVWIWTPTPLKPSEPAFTSLSVLSIAFLMGFSTDLFFQALDRLVLNLSQWINGPSK